MTINYREQDFVEVVQEATDGHGADVILDNMGAKYLTRNVDALATEGRLVIIGMQGGTKGELDIGCPGGQARRGDRDPPSPPAGRGRRQRSADRSSSTCGRSSAEGKVRPIVHTTLPLEEVAAAHALMESSENIGKIVLTT